MSELEKDEGIVGRAQLAVAWVLYPVFKAASVLQRAERDYLGFRALWWLPGGRK